MKQILQNLSSGVTSLVEVPCPSPKSGFALIKTEKSLVSIGTERMLVDFGKANLIEKARSQPDKVKVVLEKIKTDGLAATYGAVKSKLDQPLPLGYCNVGTVIDPTNTGLEKEARVVSNGNHAEVVRVPKNLVAVIPEGVDNETASFTVIGAIAMQGIRLIAPTVGEAVVIVGLGLIGLLAVQILRASGCRVLGIDYDSKKCTLARQFGAEAVDLSKGEDPLVAAEAFSRGRGVDAVLITASSKGNDIMRQSAIMCRKRGRIVLVGVVGLELSRADFYEKELTFQVSCSYGPGRYDDDYEAKGHDYPLAFVRWTEQRNFEAVLDLMASGAIDVKPLVTHRYEIENAVEAYQNLDDPNALGILLNYSSSKEKLSQTRVSLPTSNHSSGNGKISFIGGGNYASRVLIPAFKAAGASLETLVTSGGVSAVHHGKKNGFSTASTEISAAINDSSDAIVIATQHNLHASQAIGALKKGKHVFVEKPLALSHEEIDQIEQAQAQAMSNIMVMVGYNRRFSPFVQTMKSLLEKKAAPKTFIMTMNAGDIPKGHWTQDSTVGGGRIIGEACHYIDLMRFLAGSKINRFNAVKMGDNNFVSVTEDKAIITLQFDDGSVGSIHYFANGGKAFPKERVEVFCENAVLQLDNFRVLKGYGWRGFSKSKSWKQNKGQVECAKAFVETIKNGGQPPISQDEIFEVARVSIDIAEMLRT